MTIEEQWRVALHDVIVRHPDHRSRAVLSIDRTGPTLYIGLDRAWDTTDPAKSRSDFAISSVVLTYFPGTKLAREWLAAAWAGYLQHEALELTTVRTLVDRPLDPHAEPYPTNPYNRGLRDGFPTRLTPETLRKTLLLVMDETEADRLMKEPNGED